GNRTRRGHRRDLNGNRNPELERVGFGLVPDIHLQGLKNLLRFPTLRTLRERDTHLGEGSREAEQTDPNASVPVHDLTSLLISDVTEGGPDQETGHQPCGLDSSVEVERVTTLLRSKSLQVDVPKDASSPLGKRDLSTRVGGANLVHL